MKDAPIKPPARQDGGTRLDICVEHAKKAMLIAVDPKWLDT
jgi:hypothetical protein